MSTHYIDLRVVPDPETSAAQLLGALYLRLHQTLVQQRLDSVGVSFPQYSLNPRAIGTVLRLHGDHASLTRLMADDWLKGVRDHVRMADLLPAPPNAPHRTVQRKQFKTSAERLRRRRIRRKGETAEQATKAIPTTMEHRPTLPYVHLQSRSTDQPFCLFIAMGALQSMPTPGPFNSYGLGGPATIPWF